MRNDIILSMMCHQYGFDKRDVEVEFLSYVAGEYEFKVTHWNEENTEVFKVKISVEGSKR